MVKTPPLTLVDVDGSTSNPHPPPASLGEPGRKLWQSLLADFVIDDAGGREMLMRICEAADSLAEYDSQIEADGVTVKTRSGLKDHPLLKHRLATQSFIVRSLHRLGLDIEPTRATAGRPASNHRKTSS